MKVAIIVIGDELLLGQVTDTNSGLIARTIAPYGWEVDSVMTVADNRDDIVAAVRSAMCKVPIVLTTGGLGPTRDDITKGALTDLFGGTLVEDASVLDNVRAIMAGRGLQLNDLTAAQAMVPSSATIIQNLCGTAPILRFDTPEATLVAMPGVPAETSRMFPSAVLPALLKRFGTGEHIMHTTLTLSGIPESDLAALLAPLEDAMPSYLHLAYLPQASILRLRLDGRHSDGALLQEVFASTHGHLKELCAPYLLFEGSHTVAEELLRVLKAKGLTIATAESCTGGTISQMLTAIPGSSDAMRGGVVAYCNEAKQHLLGVKASTLEAYGAVSEPTVAEMAEGARCALRADVSVATSGIAGPGGATPGKPVGTVCIAVSTSEGTVAATHRFGGNRSRVIERASLTALALALRAFREGR